MCVSYYLSISDHFCDALGDYNVYATIQSPRREDPRPAKSVIMAVTKVRTVAESLSI